MTENESKIYEELKKLCKYQRFRKFCYAKYIEDTLCDVDAAEGQVFARYLADCSVGGCIIYWEDMI